MKKKINIQRKQKQKLQQPNDKTNEKIDIKKEKELKINPLCEKELFNKSDKYYIPTCREIGCGGYLNIQFQKDDYNFYINCLCTKNKNHEFKNLFYDTFDKFYLKEKFIQKCPLCLNSIENKDKYKCIECDKLYCPSCFLNDIHIKKDLNNLQIITNKCPKDKNELIFYCLNCEQKICPFCLKKCIDDEDNPHKGHDIKSLLDEMPSLNKINSLKEKILTKEKAYEELFKSLDEWQAELHKKIEKIKQNLKSEIKILKKIFFNYNQEYMDYNYYSYFNDFYKDMKYYNYSYLTKFMERKNFEAKTENIFDLLCSVNKRPKKVTACLKEMYYRCGDNGFLENLDNKFMLLYSEEQKCFKIISTDNFDEISHLNFEDIILSLRYYPETKKIYISLDDKKAIRFIDYDSEKNSLNLRKELIEIDNVGDSFFYFFPLNGNNIITIDDYKIYLFGKDDSNKNGFKILKEKDLFNKNIYDVCKIDDKSLLFSDNNRLTFYNIENFEVEKIIENIDCKREDKSLILFKDIILVDCKEGIAMISCKNKEIIQYIQNWDNLEGKKVIRAPNDFIYITNSKNYLYKFSFNEYNLKLIKIIKIDDKNKEKKDFYTDSLEEEEISTEQKLNDYDIIISEKNIYFYNSSIYVLSEK